MKLRSLAVNQFKKYTKPTRLEGIGDGLNVVVGPNEMGKSTLLDALRAVLFEKYSSKAQPILALQNDRNLAGPVVELTFELEDGLYCITKRFIKKPYARLACPDGRLLEGDAAEFTLRELLGFEEPGKTGAKAESIGMWNVLWVQQGHSFGALELPESARSSLHTALETEVGTVLGGRRGRALPQIIARQLSELVTTSGRPRGFFKGLADQVASVTVELEELKTRRQDLSQTLEELEAAQERLDRIETRERDATDQKEVDEARRRHRELAALETRIQAAQSELELRGRDLDQLLKAQNERHQLLQQIKQLAKSAEAACATLASAEQQERDARLHLERLRSAVLEGEAAVTLADEAVSSRRRVIEVIERQERIRELQDRQQKAEQAEGRAREARKKAAAILITDDVLDAIAAAAKASETASTRLAAAATNISFDISPEQLLKVRLDGRAIEQATVPVVQPSAIEISDFGRIVVEPAIKDSDKLLAQMSDANKRLREQLEAAGATSLEDAERQCARRRKFLQEEELARQEAELHAPPGAQRPAGAEALADHIHGLLEVLDREIAELGVECLPERGEAEVAFHRAVEDAKATRHALERARAALRGPEDAFGRLQSELGSARTRHESLMAQVQSLSRELSAIQVDESDDALDARITAAREAVSIQERTVNSLQAQRGGESLEQLQARIDRLENAIRERREKRESLRITVSGLSSRVEAFEGAGLDEAIQLKERELALCSEEYQRNQREVEVLTLLLKTLQEAESEAKERYLSPVLKRLRPYLHLLFPGSEIAIDQDLQITGVIREAGHEESFQHLSMGTQEQIAILVRLAFAEMLVEQGHPATVILDDALVFSDDDRMSRMFDILTLAARNVQVLVLTCREQLFETLGGRQLSLEAGSSEELLSA
ncbi:MAG TPA: AAA family ATPase [Kiloniellales bacterium]|jgi:DNA repair exonuclease SbcCD ATPase subunit|nr:AAA family ATPase [Kiloniellales bacterium]